MSQKLFTATLLAALTLTTTSCSHKETTPSPIPSTASQGAAPSSSASSDEQVLTAYRGMWSAFVEAAKTSDAEAPQLRRFASGQALKLIVGSLYTNKQLGKVTKGDVVLSPKVAKAEPQGAPSEATVNDCVDSTKWLEYKASGGLWDDRPGGKHRTTATVKLGSDGAWKVDSFTLEGSGTC